MIVVWGFTRGTPIVPGPPWIVLDSINTAYYCNVTVKNAAGTSITVTSTVLNSSGAAYDPI